MSSQRSWIVRLFTNKGKGKNNNERNKNDNIHRIDDKNATS